MPLAFVKFEHRHTDYALTPKELLDFAKTRPEGFPYTYEVLKVLLDGQQDRGDHLSTTALLSECPRNLVLERKVPYTDTLEHLWAAFTGTMFHEQLEKAHIPGQTIVEQRYWFEHAELGWVSCKPDLIDVKYGLLEDYKSKDKLPKHPYPYRTNVAQLQMNRYIVDHAQWVELEWADEDTHLIQPYEKRADVDVPVRAAVTGKDRPEEWQELAVVYLAPREGMMRTPVQKSVDVPKKSGNGTKKARVADFWSDERCEEYLFEQYTTMREALDDYDKKKTIPPIPEGFEGWTGWLCDYCPVRAQCVEHFTRGR